MKLFAFPYSIYVIESVGLLREQYHRSLQPSGGYDRVQGKPQLNGRVHFKRLCNLKIVQLHPWCLQEEEKNLGQKSLAKINLIGEKNLKIKNFS